MRHFRSLAAVVVVSTALTFAPAASAAETPDAAGSVQLAGLEGSVNGSTGQPKPEVDHWNMIRALLGQFHIAMSGVGPAAMSQDMSAQTSVDEALIYNTESSLDGSFAGAAAMSGQDGISRPVLGLISITALIAAAVGGWAAWEAANNR